MALALFKAGLKPFTESIHFLEIGLPNFAGTSFQVWNTFQALEFHQSGKGKLHFIVVQHLKPEHFVTRKAQMLDSLDHFAVFVEEITDDDDDTLALDPACHLVQHMGQRGFTLGIEIC